MRGAAATRRGAAQVGVVRAGDHRGDEQRVRADTGAPRWTNLKRRVERAIAGRCSTPGRSTRSRSRRATMDEAQRNKQLVLDAYSGRPGALMAALAPDIEYTLMGSTHRFARTFRGRDDVAQNLFAEVGAVLARGRMTPINAVAEGDQVVVEFEGEGRTKDGRDYNNRYCSVFRIANGRITRIREYLDTDLTRSVFG